MARRSSSYLTIDFAIPQLSQPAYERVIAIASGETARHSTKLLRFANNCAILLFVKTFVSSYRSESLSDLLGTEGCG